MHARTHTHTHIYIYVYMQHKLYEMKEWYKIYMFISRQTTVVTEQRAFKPASKLIAYVSVVFQHQNLKTKLIIYIYVCVCVCVCV